MKKQERRGWGLGPLHLSFEFNGRLTVKHNINANKIPPIESCIVCLVYRREKKELITKRRRSNRHV